MGAPDDPRSTADDDPRSRRGLRGRARQVARAAILEAAEQVFAERGVSGARMVDIAAVAGVATGTLYNYFDSKQAIIQSLTRLRLGEYNRRLAAVCAAAADPEQALRALVRTTFEFLDAHRAMYLVVVELGGASLLGLRAVGGPGAAELQEVYLRLYAEVVAGLAGAGRLRADVGLDRLVAFLIGTMTGLVQDWALAGAGEPLVERAELVCDLFLTGAGART